MSAAMQDDSHTVEQLSALVDGEVDDAAVVRQACAAWQSDAEARRIWHTWQVIGDVMRSDDLAAGADRGASFMAALNARLALEPVVLAPAAPSRSKAVLQRAVGLAGRQRERRWALPAAMAAGFALVVGTFSLLQLGDAPSTQAPSASLADAGTAATDGANASATESVVSIDQPRLVAMNPTLMRDARLDRYLAAHKQFAGSSALGVPSVFLRSATIDSEAR